MRFQIKFNRTTEQCMLPMDYQYYISAWIYKVLKLADKDFARFLHEKGYGFNGTKLYKLFCFSRLDFGKPRLWKDRGIFEILNTNLSLKVAFDVPDAAVNFIKGLFIEQEFYMGNKYNGIDLKVVSVEALPEPTFSIIMSYNLKTPWVVSYKTDNDKNARYLKPDEPDLDFNALSVKHIAEKYRNTHKDDLSESEISMEMITPYKRSGYVIKPGTPQQTRVVGNLFGFTLSAPVDVHKMIWNAGISEKSSSGFGWVELELKPPRFQKP